METDFIEKEIKSNFKTYRICDAWLADHKYESEFSIFHINIRSLRKHWDQLNIMLQKSLKYLDCLVISETNIRKSETSLYKLENFENYFLVRERVKQVVALLSLLRTSTKAVLKKSLQIIEAKAALKQ